MQVVRSLFAPAAALVLCGCALRALESRATAPDAGAQLASLGDRYWTALLATTTLQGLNQNGVGHLGGPLYASSLGDRRFDDRLDDLGPEAHAKLLAELRALGSELALLPTAALSGEDVLSAEILAEQLADALGAEACRSELWQADPQNGPQTQFAQAALYARADTPEGARAHAARLSQASRYFHQLVENLRSGLAVGLVAPRANVVRMVEQLDGLIAAGVDRSPLLPEVKSGKAALAAVRRAIVDSVLPGARELRDFLRDELSPRARSDERIGVWALPGGADCYRFQVRHHAGDRSPEELHRLGQEELSRIEAEAAEVALLAGALREADGRVDLRAFRAHLQHLPDQFKRSGAELLAWNRELLARATEALPRAFGELMLRPIEVRAVEAYRAPAFTVGYYQPAPVDGSQPAIYYVNTYRPETRALYNNEALLFHEAVPGHHLQGSEMQELRGLPAYRRQFGPTAYIEGWALYTERMSDETLHLYSGPLARFGMLGYQAWRAARLVVDTGMHALHWDRERCVRFLVDHTTLPRGEAESEIDRYAAMPGQALGYLIGELEIFRLRRAAEEKLGARFDVRGFHAAVLRHGPVSMAVLARLVDEWVRAQGFRD